MNYQVILTAHALQRLYQRTPRQVSTFKRKFITGIKANQHFKTHKGQERRMQMGDYGALFSIDGQYTYHIITIYTRRLHTKNA